MRRHDRGNARGNSRAERHELDLIQSRDIAVNGWKCEMRIHGRIAVSGKVLGTGQKTRVLVTANGGRPQPANQSRVFSIGSDTDDRVVRVVVDVHNWCEIP